MFGKTLRQKTERALGVFRSTIEDLSRINVEAEAKSLEVEAKIAELEIENQDLKNLINENDAVISKIQNLLN